LTNPFRAPYDEFSKPVGEQRREAVLGLFRSTAFALLVVAVPLSLVATNVRFAASEVRVYDYSVRQYDAVATTRIPQDELFRANRELVSYFTADHPAPLRIVATNVDGRQEQLFNARETAHLADVRDLFQFLFTVQTFLVALTLVLSVVLLSVCSVRVLARALAAASALTLALLGATAVVANLGFDAAWEQFHFLAFTNDLWELDPATDHLIQMFPQDFWFDITLLIGAFTMLEALLIGGVSGVYLYLNRWGDEEEEQPGLREPAQRPLEPRPRIPPPRPRHLMH
jgi:integral membrane protein (TIGR01906 family)